MMTSMAVTVPTVTVRLAMVVMMMGRRRRYMMIGAQRAVHGKRERRHHRDSGRNAPAHQMGDTNHPGT